MSNALVYIPMTADLFHVGHLRAIQQCKKYGKVIVGLLTDEALDNYKKLIIPFKERQEILESLKDTWMVVPQGSRNPYENLVKYKIDIVVSGDGWLAEELDAIKKAKCKRRHISYYSYQSTTKIKKLCKSQ